MEKIGLQHIYLFRIFNLHLSFIKDTMVEAYTNEEIANIFKNIDQNNDGYITLQQLQYTEYAQSLFESSPATLSVFSSIPNGKMNLKDFTLLVHANRFKAVELARAKFQVQKYLNKYLTVSAPGEAAPSLKQSYIKLKAHINQQQQQKLHSFGIEFGIDKPHQQDKIKEISQTLGHPLHQVFALIKFSTPKNGHQIANRLHQLIQNTLDILKGLAPQAQQVISALKAYAKYANNYVYIVVEVDNPFMDGLISFATEVFQAISPQCAFKLKAKLQSNLSNLLTENFDYTKSGGQASLQVDIDHVTLKKLKEIIGDNLDEGQQFTPLQQLLGLMLEQVKMSTEFANLGQAISSTLEIQPNEIPKPYSQLQFIKELNIKETLGQFVEGGPDLLQLISNSSQGEGEVSINFHDIFLKITYDAHIYKVFELLG